MATPRYGVKESLSQIKERAHPEIETSGRVQSRHKPETCEERARQQRRGAANQEWQPGPGG